MSSYEFYDFFKNSFFLENLRCLGLPLTKVSCQDKKER